jgi:hypothetical protein
MNVNHHLLEQAGLHVPESLRWSFRFIDPTLIGQQLRFSHMAFTCVEAAFLRHFMQRHPLAVGVVEFIGCSFESKECADLLKDCFAHVATVTNNGFKVRVYLSWNNNSIRADWFPWVLDFATELCLNDCSLGDVGFKTVANTLLGGNAKNNLRALSVVNNNITSKGLNTSRGTVLAVGKSQHEWQPSTVG